MHSLPVTGDSARDRKIYENTRGNKIHEERMLSEEKTDGDINNARFETFPCPLQFMSILYKFLGLKCKEINILEIYKQKFVFKQPN
jgi:hypothetical protein